MLYGLKDELWNNFIIVPLKKGNFKFREELMNVLENTSPNGARDESTVGNLPILDPSL